MTNLVCDTVVWSRPWPVFTRPPVGFLDLKNKHIAAVFSVFSRANEPVPRLWLDLAILPPYPQLRTSTLL